jgi:peptidoglycan hydrolase-like protein with peptidoglycan-binding domain
VSAIDEGPELRAGDRGEWVTYLQERLEAAGCSPDGIDGEFGESTTNAVRRFQAASGLDETGVVDARTWARLATGESHA